MPGLPIRRLLGADFEGVGSARPAGGALRRNSSSSAESYCTAPEILGRLHAEKIMGQHDRSYRAFFAHLRMVQDLLRDIVGERWVNLIDLDSGEQVNASFVSPRHEKRESDVIWKFLRKGGEEPVYVYILMEFQSRPAPPCRSA
jgi:hypothetical protein